MTDTLAEEVVDPHAPDGGNHPDAVPQTAPEGPQEAEQAPPPQPIFETAFVVYMNPQGHWMVAQNIHDASTMQIMRPPTVDDYHNASTTIIKDIAVQETANLAAQLAVQLQMQALDQKAEQVRQAQMNEQIQKFTGQAPGGVPDLSQLRRR